MQKNLKVLLNGVDRVKSFVNVVTTFDCDFDLVSGRYVIDAKSIMGIFSLDISKPLTLVVHIVDNDETLLGKIEAALKEYTV